MDEHRVALPSTQPAVATHELLERRDLAVVRVDAAVDDDVPYMRKAGQVCHVGGGVGAERRERVHPLIPRLVHEVDAVRPYGDGAAAVAADGDEAHPIVGGQRLDESWMQALEALPRQPFGFAREVDEGEVARCGHDEVRVRVTGSGCGVCAAMPQGAAARRPDRPGPSTRLTQKRRHGTPCLVAVGADERMLPEGRAGGREQPAYDVLERLAIALPERCTLALAVIGEHHELIRPLRERSRSLQHAEGPVDAGE